MVPLLADSLAAEASNNRATNELHNRGKDCDAPADPEAIEVAQGACGQADDGSLAALRREMPYMAQT